MMLEQLGIHRQNKKSRHKSYTFHKLTQITCLVKHKTIKILEDNTGGNIDDLGCDEDFLDTTIAQLMSEKNQQVGIH